MKIKICGMKYPENITAISALQPDLMGFIFYQKSKRYVGDDFSNHTLQHMPGNIKKTGVFVNETNERILEIYKYYQLDFVQLHGNETSIQCRALSKKNIPVIKAFQVDDIFDFNELTPYQKICSYFLFDTKTDQNGGSGKTFNWQMLDRYSLHIPFILSGGIGVDNIDDALQLHHPMLYGLDINSKLETEPGVKSPEGCKTIIQKIRNYESI